MLVFIKPYCFHTLSISITEHYLELQGLFDLIQGMERLMMENRVAG